MHRECQGEPIEAATLEACHGSGRKQRLNHSEDAIKEDAALVLQQKCTTMSRQDLCNLAREIVHSFLESL